MHCKRAVFSFCKGVNSGVFWAMIDACDVWRCHFAQTSNINSIIIYMKHFLVYIEETIKKHWDRSSVTNYGANSYTYGEVAAKIAKTHLLFDKYGIKKGDHVAICARNSAEWCITFLAITSYGAVAVPLLADFLPRNIVELTNISDSRLLFVDKHIRAAIERENLMDEFAGYVKVDGVVDIVNLSTINSCGTSISVKGEDLNEAFAVCYPQGVNAADFHLEAGSLDDISVVSYTSGTSSSPKGVMLPAKSLSGNLEQARKLVPINENEENNSLSILPLAHIFGLAFDFIFLFSCACHIHIFTERPVPIRLLKALSDVKPVIFLTVPLLVEKIFRSKVIPTLNKPVMKFLTSLPWVRQAIFKKVRANILNAFGGNLGKFGFFIGGAAISRDVDKVMQLVKIPYAVGYGMTECGPLISYKGYAHPSLGETGGITSPTLEFRIDSDAPSRVPGEIQVRGDVVTVGYYKNEEATKASFTTDGWLKTGDMGIQDNTGTVYIKGRCKNMILTGSGQNIYPEEIEDMINRLPYVLESLVVGRKHSIIALVVVDKDAAKAAGLSESEADAAVEKNVLALNASLPSYSQISRCEMRKEPFEKTPKLSIKRFMYN